ncbi:hypothetical protein CKAN_02660400 [Cinnamomum micranthum f. kanehirae]|uniref:Uncharacterized protein n=1 Tax=Cinnamomum micranthum f. kanehirae TaxID=337451 RepID=A0A3S3RB54_9MAGN|nr:hypothetical protein CKAN_02660400 [Cinnamomum micranthum f. kanehirae]
MLKFFEELGYQQQEKSWLKKDYRTFLIEPSLLENFENTPWDEEGTSYVPPPYARLDGDPNNPIIICIITYLKKNDNTNSVAIEEIEQEHECLTIDHWDGSFIQIMMSTEEEHDEIEENDTPKEETVKQTSNESCPIQLRSGKQLPKRTARVEKKSKGKAVEENESTGVQSQQGAKKVVNEKSLTKYDVLAHLKKIQAPLNVYDVLRLSEHIREALIKALLDPDKFLNEIHQTETELENAFSPNICAACLATTSFTDEDLLLRMKAHNRPLFVKGVLAKVKLNRIMLDCGSTVNLIPLKTLLSLGMTVNDLESSNLVITGFNESNQQALRTNRLKLTVGDLTTNEDALKYIMIGYEMGRDTVQQKQAKKNKSKGKPYHHNGMQDSVNMISGEEQDAGKEYEELVNDPEEAPPLLEDGRQATVDELVEINLGSPEEPKITYVSKLLSDDEMKEYVAYLSKYKDVFAWSYKEMPGLDPKVATHISIRFF